MFYIYYYLVLIIPVVNKCYRWGHLKVSGTVEESYTSYYMQLTGWHRWIRLKWNSYRIVNVEGDCIERGSKILSYSKSLVKQFLD